MRCCRRQLRIITCRSFTSSAFSVTAIPSRFLLRASMAAQFRCSPSMSADRIRVLFEDDAVVVVEKPSGLLTMATETEKERTVYAILRAAANRRRPPEKIFIVHRLDREASGLLVFAKTIEAKEKLQEQFKDHSA